PSGSLRCVALSHTDPRKEALARDLLARFAHAPDRPYGPAAVMRTGQTAFYPSITEEMLAAVVEDPALLAPFRELGLHASLVVPLVARGQTLGTISLLLTEPGRRFQPEDVALAEDLARRASVAVDNAWLFQTAQEAMAQKDLALRALEAERARLEAVLQQMPAAVVLAEAPSGRIVFSNAKVEQVLGEAVPPLSNTADFERFWSAWPRDRGYAHYDPSEWPLMRAIQRGEALVDREFELVRPDGRRATLLTSTAPIHDRDGRIVAAVATFTDITSRKRAEDGLRFLAEAGEILASSLDYATTLKSVARLAVPRLADWCGVDIVEEDGSVSRLAVAHVDPAKVEWAYQLQQRYPFDPDAPSGLARVLRTGEAEFYPELSEEMLLASARDAEEEEIIRRIGFSAVMIVPLIARGRTLGAITLVSAESGRRYDEDDLALARELARRAALAVDNARLYREAQEAEARSRQQAARVRALAEASRAFAEASLDLQAVIDTVSRHIAQAIDDLCVVRLLSEDGRWLEPVAVHHTDPDALALMRELVARDPFPADEGFLGQVIQRGESLFI
ncbi:MAG: GAF domain-containing protein, partial [Thermomicrobiaceae bacterium]|nr:GAF domain-containing protein [Thermomicrobiaceae bacterium]